MNQDMYFYQEPHYIHDGIHRRLVDYNIDNTDNPIIQCYQSESKQDYKTLFKVLDPQIVSMHQNAMLPFSMIMLWYNTNIKWSNLLITMVLEQDAIETFCAEFIDQIENTCKQLTPMDKKSVIYRHFINGENMFATAGRVWLTRKHAENILKNRDKSLLYNDLGYLLKQYEKVNTVLGDSIENHLLELENFMGIKLQEELEGLTEKLTRGKSNG